MNHHLGNYWPEAWGNIELVDGTGSYLIDETGKKYLDFIAGWCVGNIGWKRKEIADAVAKETERGVYAYPMMRFRENEDFAARLVEITPNPELARVFRSTSGSEAVEMAIKLARAATRKKNIVSIDGVYHGHTYAAASVGIACNANMAPCAPGFIKIPMPNAYRGVSGNEVIRQFETLVSENNDIAAFLTEPVWSNAGVIIPPSDFLPAIEKICRQSNILFIMDEVATGFGRCGKLFASELWNLKPDMLCLAKGLTGGFASAGATLVTEGIFNAYKNCDYLPVYSTFMWLPTDLSAMRANVEVLLRERLWENSRTVGDYLLKQLKVLEEHKNVGQIRGIGLLAGVEIVADKKSKAPDQALAEKIRQKCLANGLVFDTAANILFISPPLILTKDQAKTGAEILKQIIESF